ncbi:hypothetical protein jhhlp_003183 [Lomentospora prolificans]|uniref:PH domain-containing protein n=1 Tax=Lomentospora prolificans TaxID=41688 RepID=A0A2N3NG52_9PEZI|nr:hypothetical protein jhhlp_003183 [Lomentospora prolificans]
MSAPTSQLPSRAATGMSAFSDEAIPEVDPSTTAGLLSERLQAWKHAVGYLEDYVTAVEKIHKAHAKEYERALKASVCDEGIPPLLYPTATPTNGAQTISNPLREGHHFDQSLGGIAGFFENLRHNTQAIINTNLETEKALKGNVLPVLERLHKEIKHKAKELASGAAKGAKEVEKARNTTQKHIELLGQQTASWESAGGKISGHDDPYVIKRGVVHRLHKQVLEENAHRGDLIAVQSNFEEFEAHTIGVLQQAMEAFTQLAGGQGEKIRTLHSDMLGAIQRVPPEFEWLNFVSRSGDLLVDPNEQPRVVDAITFPNMDHTSTKPLIEGTLERKSRNKLSWGYQTSYYVITPAKFLHEFKDSDDSRHDPKPELSVYLPGALIGAPSGDKFSVKGKDTSKTLSSKLSGSSELSFKAHTPADAEKWFRIIKEVADSATPMSPTSPTSPLSPPSPSEASPAASGAAPAAASAVAPSEEKLEMNEAKPISPAGDHPPQESGVSPGATPVAAPAPAAAAPAEAKVATTNTK